MILSAQFYSYRFIRTILSNDILSNDILSNDILSVYHFVRYHFVLEPIKDDAVIVPFILETKNSLVLMYKAKETHMLSHSEEVFVKLGHTILECFDLLALPNISLYIWAKTVSVKSRLLAHIHNTLLI